MLRGHRAPCQHRRPSRAQEARFSALGARQQRRCLAASARNAQRAPKDSGRLAVHIIQPLPLLLPLVLSNNAIARQADFLAELAQRVQRKNG